MAFVSNGVKKSAKSFMSLGGIVSKSFMSLGGIVSMPLDFFLPRFLRFSISFTLTVLEENLSLSETLDPLLRV